MEERIQLAVQLFKEGYNCSQSVVAAFADLYGIDRLTALRMSASFGGGIGRMRMTCGAACGLFLLVGLETGAVEGDDRTGKSANYEAVQGVAREFESENGSLICSELLGLASHTPISSQAEARTESYYKKRPCAMMVENAARIFARFYEQRHNNCML